MVAVAAVGVERDVRVVSAVKELSARVSRAIAQEEEVDVVDVETDAELHVELHAEDVAETLEVVQSPLRIRSRSRPLAKPCLLFLAAMLAGCSCISV